MFYLFISSVQAIAWHAHLFAILLLNAPLNMTSVLALFVIVRDSYLLINRYR